MKLEEDPYEYRGVRLIEKRPGRYDIERGKTEALKYLERKHGTGWEFFMVDAGPRILPQQPTKSLPGLVFLFRRRNEYVHD
jgi:hypothetical protein